MEGRYFVYVDLQGYDGDHRFSVEATGADDAIEHVVKIVLPREYPGVPFHLVGVLRRAPEQSRL